MARRILLVEDHRDIAQLIALHLGDLGLQVDCAEDGEQGLALALRGGYDLIILDLMLPGIDGLAICRRLRESAHYTPVLMLTAKSSELDRVLGLELGADDYITKPFSIRELIARVKALFRRVDFLSEGQAQDGALPLCAGDLSIDNTCREVSISGQPVPLTAREFDLLHHFAQHPGRVYTRAQLLDSVWGYAHEGYEHTVNSHINRLRAKIEQDPSQPRYILTVWGVGYKFIAQTAAN